ncbi:hypothetical protein R1sor_012610 [Riccia sorocarpa]|uniref:Uncharacterized protein n=1 Tax=Riccia sorocarpa TaxID=122646 RepID=A0ABD3I7I8_9MARC
MCEPITGNMFIRFHHLSQLMRMDRTTQCGHGGSGNCFVVGVRDPEHSKTLGAHDVVFYVAKRMLLKESNRHDNKDIDPEGRRIIRNLVFVSIGDLGWAQTKDQAKEGRRLYLVGNLDPHAWVAPELTREKACPDWRGHMTPSQRSTYDDEMFAKGFPTGASLPHAVHGLRLREALDRMTTINIANRIDHHGPREIGKDKL